MCTCAHNHQSEEEEEEKFNNKKDMSNIYLYTVYEIYINVFEYVDIVKYRIV